MTLFQLVVGGGVVSSFALALVLASLLPVHRSRCVFTMSGREGARAPIPGSRNGVGEAVPLAAQNTADVPQPSAA